MQVMAHDTEMDDMKFEQALRDKSHKELMRALAQIQTSINSNSLVNSKIIEVLAANQKAIEVLTVKVSEMTKMDMKPNVTVTTNQDAVVSELSKLSSELKAICSEPEKEEKEWDFQIVRNQYNNQIQSVKAKSK
jgi:hypothetical protein